MHAYTMGGAGAPRMARSAPDAQTRGERSRGRRRSPPAPRVGTARTGGGGTAMDIGMVMDFGLLHGLFYSVAAESRQRLGSGMR